MNKPRVFIVEDELIFAYELKEMLERNGYEVVKLLKRGKDTIKAAEEFKPDIILMDIQLKGEIDGITTMEMIRRDKEMPVIYLTGNNYLEDSERLTQTKPVAVITKPIAIKRLLAVMNGYFTGR